MSKEEAKLLIQDFDPTKEYTFWVSAVNGQQESKALQAKHEGETRFSSSSSGFPKDLFRFLRCYGQQPSRPLPLRNSPLQASPVYVNLCVPFS